MNWQRVQPYMHEMGIAGIAPANSFTKPFWRSVTHDEVYVHDYNSPRAARSGISASIQFYNYARPPSGARQPSPVPAIKNCATFSVVSRCIQYMFMCIRVSWPVSHSAQALHLRNACSSYLV